MLLRIPKAALPLLFSVSVQAVVIVNEVSDTGTTGQCDGADWVELFNEGATDVALGGWILFNDNGKSDDKAFNFDDASSIAAGAYMVICCNSNDGTGAAFRIGSDDTISLQNPSGSVVSTSGALLGSGEFGQTYAVNNQGTYEYTITATPGAKNVIKKNELDRRALVAEVSYTECMASKCPVSQNMTWPDGWGQSADADIESIKNGGQIASEVDCACNNCVYDELKSWPAYEVGACEVAAEHMPAPSGSTSSAIRLTHLFSLFFAVAWAIAR